MKPEKTYTKEILLYQWVSIIKEIYPNRKTVNPYIQETKNITKTLKLEHKLLFHDILHCITLINSESRRDEDKKIVSSQYDLLNALHMLCPPSRINSRVLEAHQKLLEHFKDSVFTYLKAERFLDVSHSTIKRILYALIAQKMAIKLPETDYRTALFKVIPQSKEITITEESQESIFDTMQGEWKDFQGFIEF